MKFFVIKGCFPAIVCFWAFFSAVSLGALSAHADGWTSFTSEETQPLTCSLGSFVTGLRCTGRYCVWRDNQGGSGATIRMR
jgi:hypothetical protein